MMLSSPAVMPTASPPTTAVSTALTVPTWAPSSRSTGSPTTALSSSAVPDSSPVPAWEESLSPLPLSASSVSAASSSGCSAAVSPSLDPVPSSESPMRPGTRMSARTRTTARPAAPTVIMPVLLLSQAPTPPPLCAGGSGAPGMDAGVWIGPVMCGGIGAPGVGIGEPGGMGPPGVGIPGAAIGTVGPAGCEVTCGGSAGLGTGGGDEASAWATRPPSETASSGCSIAAGARPSSRWSIVATSGIRLAAPTRNRPASWSLGSPDSRMTPCVMRTVRSISGAATDSSSSRVRCASMSSSGIVRSVEVLRESRSLAWRTSSRKAVRWRRSARSIGAVRRCQRSSSGWTLAATCSARAWSKSRPPRSSAPSTASTSKPVPERRRTVASKVPPPRS